MPIELFHHGRHLHYLAYRFDTADIICDVTFTPVYFVYCYSFEEYLPSASRHLLTSQRFPFAAAVATAPL